MAVVSSHSECGTDQKIRDQRPVRSFKGTVVCFPYGVNDRQPMATYYRIIGVQIGNLLR